MVTFFLSKCILFTPLYLRLDRISIVCVRNKYLLEVFDKQTNPNSTHEQTQTRLNSGNDGSLSVQNVLSFSLLSTNLNIKSSRNIILPVVLYGFEVWSVKLREEHRPSVFESRMLSNMLEPQREKATEQKTA